MRKLTCPPEAETIGLLLSSFTDNVQGKEVLPIMKKHGVFDLQPFEWYPVQMLLDALNELGETPNTMLNYVAIGMEIGAGVPIPPDMENPTLEDVLMIWDKLYQDLHRGADVGGITIEKVSDTFFKTHQSVVYPDDMSYGVLFAYGRRFLPRGTQFIVFYDPEVTPRDQGSEGPATLINIRWDVE